MALPKGNEKYETYTDQLVYFSARLAADPKTAGIAESVETVLKGVDEAQALLTDARRDEVRARALRDHKDEIGDRKVRRYRRQVDVVEDVTFVVDRLFSRGLNYLTAPRGRAQLDRLSTLHSATDDLLASEQVSAHPEADELRATLEQGKATLAGAIDELEKAVTGWEAQTVELARARDLFRFRRSNGVSQLGAVLGELRALLDGDVRAAYSYTAPARSRGGAEVIEVTEADEVPEGEAGDGESG
ncbi:hypothetical protein [Enhygromyxa salina]|nr:hypothetical protein [Enhygromyxa salina]